MKRRDTLTLAAAPLLLPTLPSRAAGGERVLRYAFPIAETGFDPAAINDTYSRIICCHIFDALYEYDHLARPARILPCTAAAMPEVSDDFRTWTIRIQPGIFFADDPAFKGRKRELVADDYVFSFKRFVDPAVKSPLWTSMQTWTMLGLAELRADAVENKKPFDYDKPIEGLRALDRYTLQLKLAEARPRLLENLAISDLFGALAREVVQAYGDAIMAHPVGTGPFRLAAWRRSSQIVLERNPAYRERLWDCQPAATDAEGQAIAAKLRGRRLPLIDRVEVSIIEESQPRWLSFLNGQQNMIDRVPAEFINIAYPGRQLAPNLAKMGVKAELGLTADITLTIYNMEHPVIGGMQPERVALRRAINLGIDLEREIRLARRGMAVVAQGPLMPHTTGYDPAFKSENGEYNPAKAKALLDLYGYVDKDGDGWREQPNGEPLVLERSTQPDALSRQFDELWQRNMKDIGIRIQLKYAKWPETLKSVRTGQFMSWGIGYGGAGGDGQGSLARYYSKQAGQQNLSRFSLPAFDEIYDRAQVLPDGPERLALFKQAQRLGLAYAPYKNHTHRYVLDMVHRQVVGYRRPLYWNPWWQFVDIEPDTRAVA
ncbi:ABC transporter substrate-binding protein [Pseudorhodoferax sp.]|uniref:ABC transporter substrate-binding protein n=1 Tax=Pseudorhodoferax sp. TaxID=1993553 RepID=UPI002DD64881|nr:ABC transporter substrate-binding protein [Pseudorhodoferax sp.]